jgi:hypothetical protein
MENLTQSTALAPVHLRKADGLMLRDHWPFVRAKLLTIKQKTPKAHNRWHPEQIRFELLKGIANQATWELWFILGEQEQVQGFIITSCDPDRWIHVPLTLFIEFGWLDARHPLVFEQAIPHVRRIAQERGLVDVEYVSVRTGMLRRQSRVAMLCKEQIAPTFVTFRLSVVEED